LNINKDVFKIASLRLFINLDDVLQQVTESK